MTSIYNGRMIFKRRQREIYKRRCKKRIDWTGGIFHVDEIITIALQGIIVSDSRRNFRVPMAKVSYTGHNGTRQDRIKQIYI